MQTNKNTIQKELENRIIRLERELEIEAALERVRSRSLAMHKSEELSKVVQALYKEIFGLGIDIYYINITTDFSIIENGMNIWLAADGRDYLQKFHIPYIKHSNYLEHPINKRFIKALKNETEFYTESYSQRLKNEYFNSLIENSDLKNTTKERQDNLYNAPGLVRAIMKSKNSILIFDRLQLEEFSKEEEEIFKRFGRVFEQAYTRFLDLQKAEEQAREAQIEAALEKVRSRSLAMHKSDELQEVANTVFTNLKGLNIQIDTASILLLSEQNADLNIWIGMESDKGYSTTSIHVPEINDPAMAYYSEVIKTRKNLFTKSYTYEEKNKLWNHLFKHSGFKIIPDERKKMILDAKSYIISIALHKNTGIQLIRYSGLPFSEKENETLQRFGKVFEQAYVRFLDLQKAEAQAREAQIEAALEKVRSASMAMHKSEELVQVVRILDKQILGLGIETEGTQIITDFSNPEKSCNDWISREGYDYPEKFHVPYINHPITEDFFNAVEKNIEFFTAIYPETEKNEYLKLLFKYSDFGTLPKEMQDIVYNTPGMARAVVLSKNSILIIARYNLKEYTKEEGEILKRFGKVFEQAYTRFLDLQKAEEQAREAQIEAALERVRARTMAMHHSDELSETAKAVFEQFYTLGNIPDRISIGIFNEEENLAEVYVTDQSGDRLNMAFEASLDEPTSVSKLYQAWKRKESTHIVHLFGGELRKWVKYCREKLGLIMDPEKIRDDRFHNAAFFSKGLLLLTTSQQIDKATLQLLSRFAHVFGQTYTRFLDLQKAEKQAREAQIEASLERVRSRSLAMHHTSEIQAVIHTVHEELLKLNISIVGGSFVVINNDIDIELSAWGSGGTADTSTEVIIPNFGKPFTTNLLNGIQQGPGFFTEEFTNQEKIEYFKELFELEPWSELTTEQKKEVLESKGGYTRSCCVLNHTSIFIINQTGRKFSEEDNDILKRFTKVFEQTYTRFLDLQKAEAQAREAQIEAALEKVRSSSLAMHNSSQIREIVKVVFEKLKELKFAIDGGVFVATISKKTDTINFWIGDDHTEYPSRFDFPKYDAPPIIDILNAVKTGVEFISKTYSFKEKNSWFEYAFSHTELKTALPEDFKKWILEQEYLTQTFSLQKNSMIGVHFHHEKKLTENEVEILKRFSKVFEQSYVRFLDLQKAEAQAREAQIEAALERVRSRTMAMQKSDELLDVATVLFQQVKALGVPQWNCGFNIWTIGEEEFTYYPGSPDGIISPSPCKISLTEHPIFRRFDESRRRGDELLVYEKEGEEQREHYQYMLSLPGVGDLLQSMLNVGFEFPKFQIDHLANFSYGNLIFITYEHFPEMHDVFKRFAIVFEQTYTRFLDLQKAEAQTREAQIEASLERVRSKSLAMQKSEELNEVVKTLYNEFSVLKVNFHVVVLQQIIPDSKDMFLWLSANDGSYNNIIRWPYAGLPFQNSLYKAWTNEETLELTISGEETKEFMEDYFKIEAVPKERKKAVKNVEIIESIASYQKLTGIVLMRYSKGSYSADEKNIVQRFSKVFEQTYTRFRDLQKAEAQAIEVTKQASLDRVRGEIASMRSKEDLQRITPLIWNELTTLGVPFIRCGVFIVNEAKENVEVFLSTPDGKPLGMLNLSFDSNELTSNSIKAWKKSQVYRQHWNKVEFVNWTSSLLEHGQIGNSQEYQGTIEPPEKLDLHFIPFKQGMLYVGSTEALNEETIDLVQSLANAFAIAYARYEDFNELDKAKQSIEITLSELKAAQKQLIQSEKMASLGELTAGIAHEIQNPLNFVNNFSEVTEELLEELEEESALRQAQGTNNSELEKELINDIKENLKKINHHGNRASSIVKGMLEHSRTSSGKKELTDINALADEYLRLAYHGLRAKDKDFNATFETHFDPNLPKIEVIPQDIGRVLLNLINNAFQACIERSSDASTEPGRSAVKNQGEKFYKPLVSVATQLITNNQLQISITDNGPGIPDSIKDKIFQPFFTTKPTGQGTGLGLSLVYDIVTKGHGGKIEVESNAGKGTSFIIYLPVFL